MKIIKVIKIAYGAVIAAAVIFLTVLASLALLLGISGIDREKPGSVFGFRAFIVISGSMNPEFDAGSLIITKEMSSNALKERDIVTYMPLAGNIPLTHRIVTVVNDIYGTRFITRGDANNIDDPVPVPSESVLGKVVFFRNGLGKFIENLRTPAGLAATAASILTLLFVIPYVLGRICKSISNKTGIYIKYICQ